MIDGILTAEELELLEPWARRNYQRAVEAGDETIVCHYYGLVQEIKESERLRDEATTVRR